MQLTNWIHTQKKMVWIHFCRSLLSDLGRCSFFSSEISSAHGSIGIICIVWHSILRWYYGFSLKYEIRLLLLPNICHQHIKIQHISCYVFQFVQLKSIFSLSLFSSLGKHWHLAMCSPIWLLFRHAHLYAMRVIWHLSHFQISVFFSIQKIETLMLQDVFFHRF